jgi:hypothetical protein
MLFTASYQTPLHRRPLLRLNSCSGSRCPCTPCLPCASSDTDEQPGAEQKRCKRSPAASRHTRAAATWLPLPLCTIYYKAYLREAEAQWRCIRHRMKNMRSRRQYPVQHSAFWGTQIVLAHPGEQKTCPSASHTPRTLGPRPRRFLL